MRSTKNADLIGHDKFLSWRQLDGCSVTRPFLSPAKGVACETRQLLGLAVKGPWLAPGGPTLGLAALAGSENATLTFQGVHFWQGRLLGL